MKDDVISRQAAIELIHSLYPSAPILQMNRKRWEEKYKSYIEAEKALEMLPSAQPEIIRCKDCIHKPTITSDFYENGFDIEFPDFRCPCRCDDGWYNWIPEDDWFCGNGERKKE